LAASEEELVSNGYKVLTGNSLKEFKLRYQADIDVGQKTKALGIFDFSSFLDIDMLLIDKNEKIQRNNSLKNEKIQRNNQKSSKVQYETGTCPLLSNAHRTDVQAGL